MAALLSKFNCDPTQLADLPRAGIVAVGVVGTMYHYETWLKRWFRPDEQAFQLMVQSLRLAIDCATTGELDRDELMKVHESVTRTLDEANQEAGSASMGEYYGDLMGDEDLVSSQGVHRDNMDAECDLMKFADWLLSSCLASEHAEVIKKVSAIIGEMGSIPHARRGELEQIVEHCKAAVQQSQDNFLAPQDCFVELPVIFAAGDST